MTDRHKIRKREYVVSIVRKVVDKIIDAISSRRRLTANRFRQPTDWIRLVMLGILLINLAALSLIQSLTDRRMDGYFPGMGTIFGGLLIGIIILRIARPAVYLDWIAAAILQVSLGFFLAQQPGLLSGSTFALFCLIFIILGIVRLWIGVTREPGKGAASLMAGALTSLFCVTWAVFDRFATLGVSPDVILATDLILTGASVIGFGLASKAT